MWRIKYYLPFILVVFIASFFISKFIVSHKHIEELRVEEPIDSRVHAVYDYLSTKFYEMPDYKTFKEYLYNIDNRKLLLSRLDAMQVNYLYFPPGYSDSLNSISLFDHNLFYKWETLTTFNYNRFFIYLFLFGFFPLLIFEFFVWVYVSMKKRKST